MNNPAKSTLTWKSRLLLIGLAFIVSSIVAFFQESPGYMDADYYFAGGVQLAQGNGFTEPYIWNYLDNSTSLPHPSHAYWMPLASLIAAGGMIIAGTQTWLAGRIGFILISMIVPVVTAELAYSFSKREDLSIASGLLAIFSGYYAAYINTSDTFGVYILLGGLFFLIAHRNDKGSYFFLGILSGLFHLARADGIIWLLISFLIIVPLNMNNKNTLPLVIKSLAISLSGYFLIMGPWIIRNLLVFGSPLGPRSINMLWMTHYDQLFSFPPEIAIGEWLNQGFIGILSVRFSSLFANLQNILAVQGSIFLLPLMVIGALKLKQDKRIYVLASGMIAYLLMMSFIFPFAGMRGGFFHAGASLQSILWALAPVGLVVSVEWVGEKRAWNIDKAKIVFLTSIIIFSMVFTGYIATSKLVNFETKKKIWNHEAELYQSIGKIIENTEKTQVTVIVRNPPGFFLATGHQAIGIPDGTEKNLLMAADEFEADYLILESGGFPQGLKNLYEGSEFNSRIILIDEVNKTKLYEIIPGN